MYSTSTRTARGIRKAADPVTRFDPLQDFPSSIRTRYLIRYLPVLSIKFKKLTSHIPYILSVQRLFWHKPVAQKASNMSQGRQICHFLSPPGEARSFFRRKSCAVVILGQKNKNFEKSSPRPTNNPPEN